MHPAELAHFLQVSRALEPVLPELVLVGGWAHLLYPFHPDATPSAFTPLATLDVDFAIHDQPRGVAPIRPLLERSGFKPKMRGEEFPPLTEYVHDQNPMAIEFLAPLRGAPYDRRGRPKDTKEIASISAQTLQHIEVLLHAPWEIALPDENTARALKVRVTNPVSYITQKLMILPQRSQKSAKDVLYIHDTLMLFADATGRLRDVWQGLRGSLRQKQLRAVEASRATLTQRGTTDLHRKVIASAQRLGRTDLNSEEVLVERLTHGLLWLDD